MLGRQRKIELWKRGHAHLVLGRGGDGGGDRNYVGAAVGGVGDLLEIVVVEAHQEEEAAAILAADVRPAGNDGILRARVQGGIVEQTGRGEARGRNGEPGLLLGLPETRVKGGSVKVVRVRGCRVGIVRCVDPPAGKLPVRGLGIPSAGLEK